MALGIAQYLPRTQEMYLERETGFEPATACLEGRNSTAELLPLSVLILTLN